MRIVDFAGLLCKSFYSLAIHRGFTISSQSNWIVQDRERIALNLQYNQSPQDCKILCHHCQGFYNLVAIHFYHTDCDQNRGNPALIGGIWLQSVSIVSGLHPNCNQGAIVRFVNRRSGLWQDCNGPLSGFKGHTLKSSHSSVTSGPIKAQSVLIAFGLHKIQNLIAIGSNGLCISHDVDTILSTVL